ncbi:hypothetical protein C0995_003428 [Termitomyces sp. Mi166|nr:hypothetical protein C0995_003428 [Termitomyces sp. Mi166\
MQAACRTSIVHLKPRLRFSRASFSELGLRSSEPPRQLSDQDWEIRTGRAIYVLQHTLPDFFPLGLVTSMDKATGIPRSSRSSIPILNANPLDYQTHPDDDGEAEGIYSPKVALCYTPPVTLPPPFPTTLHVEGLPLYLASAVFIRHTLNALYVDLKLQLKKCVIHNTPRSAPPSEFPQNENSNAKTNNKRGREKNLVVGFTVTGTSRVTGAPGEWEMWHINIYIFPAHRPHQQTRRQFHLSSAPSSRV